MGQHCYGLCHPFTTDREEPRCYMGYSRPSNQECPLPSSKLEDVHGKAGIVVYQ